MRLCSCPTPLRSTNPLERLRCLRCSGWTPHGRLPTVDRATGYTNELVSLAAQLADDYAWVHSLARDPARRGHGNGRNSGVSDPTLEAILANEYREEDNRRRPRIAAYATIAARLTEQALKALRGADEAIGEALLAAEPPGPQDHTPAPFHDPATLFPGRPDLADAHAAKNRRRNRGEGTPT